MSNYENELAYACRRTREEAIRAADAGCAAAASAHRRLGILHAARAIRVTVEQELARCG